MQDKDLHQQAFNKVVLMVCLLDEYLKKEQPAEMLSVLAQLREGIRAWGDFLACDVDEAEELLGSINARQEYEDRFCPYHRIESDSNNVPSS